MSNILHLRHRANCFRKREDGSPRFAITGEWPPVLCGIKVPQYPRWTFVETIADATPAAFVMPYDWPGVAVCVDCARAARPQ